MFVSLLAVMAMAQDATPVWKLKTIAGGTEAGDGGRAFDASIRYLQGVTSDNQGNLYFSDADDHRVRRIGPDGKITTLAGDGVPGFSGDGGPAKFARINTPYGLSVTPLGDLLFCDLGNARVRRISRNGQIDTIAGGGSRAIPVSGQLLNPLEIKLLAPRNVLATKNGSIYLSEFGANRILILRSDGNLTAAPIASGDLLSPTGLALDAAGNLLYLDSGNARVRRLSPLGQIDTLVAASPALPLERPVGLALRADQSLLIADTRGDYLWSYNAEGKISRFPPGGRDVTIDPLGNAVTAGGSWLRRVDRAGLMEILIGNNWSTFRGDGGPALAARLNKPTGVVADSQGNVYFSDTANHRVRRIGADGAITTVAGNGEASYGGDGGPATEAFLNAPTYLAVDPFDNIYVSDTGNHRVRAFTPGGVIQTIAGTGRTDFSNDNILALQANVASPAGLAFDASGNLFLVERGQHRVRRIGLNGRVQTVAGNALRGGGGDGQDALLASLHTPGALSVDRTGNLYIADTGTQSIRFVEASSGRIQTLLSDLKNPEGLAVTPNGTLYFSESQSFRVRQRTLDGSLTTIAGRNGENGFNADTGNATAITLNEPAGLALHPNGALLLADRLNDRIRLLEAPAEAVSPLLQDFRVVHAASFRETSFAPGLLLSLLTVGLTQPELAQITIDGFVAPISYASATQLNFRVPEAIAGRTRVSLELRVGGALRFRENYDVVGAAPAFFEVPGADGLVFATGANGSLISDASPAHADDILTLLATGEGLHTDRNGTTIPFLAPSVELNGVAAELLSAVAAPAGVLQVTIRVPNTFRQSGRLPIRLRIGTFLNPQTQVLILQ
ncbi:hypothetical protein [Bryobacter aggregatus]|uniref:hypothetical protein n=1 Tax=Bryobacter aggregatus TaxID=360054 RepID=UPI00138DE30A|nr:hypothetical protein [Bryobacter aggregatus]